MKKHFVILFIIGVVLTFVSCEKETTGSIYGVITDRATDEPVPNANVQLRPSGATTLTGSDGSYEFFGVEEGNYKIKVSADGYLDWEDYYGYAEVRSGERTLLNLSIEKIPFLHFLDMQGDIIFMLDFGTDKDILSFEIYNPGTISHEDIKITHSCAWIADVSDPPILLEPRKGATITVQIDRYKLERGRPNWGGLSITSNKGTGGYLELKAIGLEYEDLLPVITTTPPRLSGYDVVTGGNITSDGGFNIKERGILWYMKSPYDKNPLDPVMGASNVIKSDATTNAFISTIKNASDGTILLRAYAINEKGRIGYGKTYSYRYSKEYSALPTFGYNGHIYKVAPDYPHNYWEGIDYDFAVQYCGFERYGYTDWFMPDIDQLKMMYYAKSSIGGSFEEVIESNNVKYSPIYHSRTGSYCTDLPKIYGNMQIDWVTGDIYAYSYFVVNGKYYDPTLGKYWIAHVRPIRLHE